MKRFFLLILLGILLMGCAARPQPAQPPTLSPPSATAPPLHRPTLLPSPSPAQTTYPPAQDFLPVQTSIWNTTIGPDTMSGDCKNSILPVYGLVQVTPKNNAEMIEWKNQEPKPYTLTKLQPNEYSYNGPTSIDDGVVTMTVKFLDEKSFKMVREFISKANPGCTHKHDYIGEFKWVR